MTEDSLERRRRRLIYRSTHRGTKEADLILGGFAKAHVAGMSSEELARFETLMEESDPDLMAWIGGQAPPPDGIDRAFIKRIYHFKLDS